MQRNTGAIARSRRPGAQSIILAAGIVFAVLLTATSNLLLIGSQADSTLLARALRVEAGVSELQILLHRIDAGQARYLLAAGQDDPTSLRETAEAALPALSGLQTIAAGDQSQLAALRDLEPNLRDSVDELRETIRRHDAGDHAGAVALMEHGRARELVAAIHASLDSLVGDQRRSTELRSAASARATFWLVAARRLSAIALIALLVASIIMMRQVIRDREVALQSLEIVNAGLESTIAERTAEIRRTAEVLETAISSMAPAVIVLDIDLRVVLANPAAERVLGISAGTEFAEWSKSYRVFFADGITLVPHEQRIMNRALRGEPTNNMELFVRRVDAARGSHLIANARPLRDAAGAVTGAVLVYQDVTETRQIEHQLRQAQKLEAVGQLTGGVAHDFNNILTVITGTIGILANGLAHDPLLSSIVRMIDEAADRGAELTRRLVAFARKQPLQPRATDVNALVVDAAKLLAPTLGEQIAIETVLCQDTWPALVDTSQLTSTLINLALNARDAMPAGGRLTLETANIMLDGSNVPPGPYVMIAVHDTGTGIPAAIRDKVFEPFFTTKDVGKGTGLGLSMVYGFVKQSGG
ncbi:MAG: PAS domain-containing protein, partial [Xanthobacteraceae bacterium]